MISERVAELVKKAYMEGYCDGVGYSSPLQRRIAESAWETSESKDKLQSAVTRVEG